MTGSAATNMENFRTILTMSSYDKKMASLDKFALPSGDSLQENLDAQTPTPTPPMAIRNPLRRQKRWQRQQYTNQTTVRNPLDDPIPRPATDVTLFPGKMLALPIPSVRSIDINTQREAGYMDINPITLRGETRLLPGTWGDGKEFVDSMPWLQPKRRSSQQQQQNSVSQQLPQRKPNGEVVDVKELRLKYAQTILDGKVVEESSLEFDSPSRSLITQSLLGSSLVRSSQLKTCLPEQHGPGDGEEGDWVDISEDEKSAADERKGSCPKREDSGYSSSSASFTTKAVEEKAAVAKPKKTVRFDEVAVEQPKKGMKAGTLWRAK